MFNKEESEIILRSLEMLKTHCDINRISCSEFEHGLYCEYCSDRSNCVEILPKLEKIIKKVLSLT